MMQLSRVLERLGGRRILVLGDLMLDEYIWGRVKRISPEAPVPVVEVQARSFKPGGAGNVATNLLALGAKVWVVSVVGEDETGRMLVSELQRQGAETEGVVVDGRRPTTRKTRVIAHSQQVVRIDQEDVRRMDGPPMEEVAQRFLDLLGGADALLVSDYNKGLVSPGLVKAILQETARLGKIVTVDAKPPNLPLFKGVTLIAPNETEAGLASGNPISDPDSLERAGRALLNDLALEAVLITRGPNGMALFQPEQPTAHIPAAAHHSQVYDVSGCGDTVTAVLTLALTAGADFLQAALIANYAAAVVAKKVGTATASRHEIEQIMEVAPVSVQPLPTFIEA